MSHGLLIAAPSSGAGKTTITLGLLRALTRRGTAVRGAKSGPDYIDPRFHEAACGQPCFNLDAWAMTPDRVASLAQGRNYPQDSTLIIEGAMGLFDGAPHLDPARDGKGACADLARQLNIPVILVVDAGRMAQSIAPLVAGFIGHDPTVKIAGLILNNVGSDRHRDMLLRALKPLGVTIFGTVPRSRAIAHPDRHLGLVQARERSDLDQFLEVAADVIDAHVDVAGLMACVAKITPATFTPRTLPPAQTIAVAQDDAFAFAYPHLLQDWRDQGAEITTFSPLADQAPPPAELTYLPGGYPELHAGRLSNNHHFMQGLREAAARRAVYGECGGYMVLGDGMIDAQGQRHKMAGLLSLETSFETRKLHLGYRKVQAATGPFKGGWTAHEFHYATTLKANGTPLFTACDAMETQLAATGLINGSVAGSFMHLIDAA
ncbi:cobyrinate a,c-diamide synthase [Pacificibacter marinus]|uniref:Hydrogenobyrinate a,c-diamide synthase n=1 Tax=Pacificibacter marinus TaxID=658057 RepID=A0A1Y5T3X1_9RHOB|nr:cobyrinate a,c-diamide synthase [Pacificibacter marinus]SEK97284.1 cobyrinic acid a,c-diamide synthase [Pacificibacter marinus]SLN53458.1 Cobyrinic acid A,C-diamide synthase [Pacificibacter marinus]